MRRGNLSPVGDQDFLEHHTGIDTKQHLPILYRILVANQNLDDRSSRLGLNLVHQFHRFDDAQYGSRLTTITHGYEGLGVGAEAE